MIDDNKGAANKELVKVKDDVSKRTMDEASDIYKVHCPSIMECIDGRDSLLKEAAESVLCWNVFAVSSGDVKFAIRALCDVDVVPINKIEAAETRFIEIKRLIVKARGDADVEGITKHILDTYASNIMSSLNNENEHPKIKRAAEQSLSKSIFGHKTADLNFTKKYIQDNIEDKGGDIKEKVKAAELNFIETKALIRSLISEFKENEEKGLSSVVQSIQLGIAKYNILFVLLLVLALAFAAQYLSQQALPLVAASIGAASAHLLAERNTVLGGQKKNNPPKDDEK
ncbi:hypothetical protein ACLD9R_15190 [Serratia marcescens]|uniref:hypothetical protein n=1 Tax=Serratia marcescens TaxID=615 RepID=UPI00396C808F